MRVVLEIDGRDEVHIKERLRQVVEGVYEMFMDNKEFLIGDGWQIELLAEDKKEFLIYTNEGFAIPPNLYDKEIIKNPQILGIVPGDNPDSVLESFLLGKRGEEALKQGFNKVIIRKIGKKSFRKELK